MSRSLFILKRREDYDGVVYSGNHMATGMWNSAMFVVEQLQAAGREAMAVIVTDGNDIDREVTAYDPTHVFIEGLWVTPAKFDELLAIPRHQNRTWAVRIHSDIPFLATEGIAMERIVAYMQQGVVVAPNAQRAHADLKWLQSTIGAPETSLVYLPNCYPTDFMPVVQAAEKPVLDVGCFGAFRPLKNHLEQAFVALRYAKSINKPLRFHVNSRTDQGGSPPFRNVQALLEAAGAELVIHDWEDRATFLQSLRACDVLMQVSLSETFNIVAADATYAGIPLLVSKEIAWAYPVFADPTSTTDCLAKLRLIMSNHTFFTQGNRVGLKAFAGQSASRWLSYLPA